MVRSSAILSVHHRVKTTLQRSGFTGRSLVIAVSGGPDSLALLHTLLTLRDKLKFNLHGAHLDHGIRGDASAADAAFMADAFEHLGISFTIEKADVGAFRTAHRISLELAAREVRYSFLARVAAEQQANTVVLGHTADDQVETILMHLIRGSGLTGLRGMKVVSQREVTGLVTTMLRPLLTVSRKETVAYCQAAGLSPRFDESNLSDEMTRNRIRAELLPLLEQFNPAIRDAIIRLSCSVVRDIEFLGAQTEAAWKDVASECEAGVVLQRDAFDRLAPAIQSRLLSKALAFVTDGPQDITKTHIDSMVALLDGPVGKLIDLPGQVRFSMGYESATLHRLKKDSHIPSALDRSHPLNIPGNTELPDWLVTTRFVDGEPFVSPSDRAQDLRCQDAHMALLSYSSLGGPLAVRSRVPGDRFHPLGMKAPKKLQGFMIDAKVPLSSRNAVPLVVSERGIAWVVGWRIADWAKVQSGDTVALELTFRPTR